MDGYRLLGENVARESYLSLKAGGCRLIRINVKQSIGDDARYREVSAWNEMVPDGSRLYEITVRSVSHQHPQFSFW